MTSGGARVGALLISNGSSGTTTGRLFAALAENLETVGVKVDLRLRALPRGIAAKIAALIQSEFANAWRAARSTTLIVHSALALSIIPIVGARLARRKVISTVWDIYPESTRAAGQLNNPIAFQVFRLLEQLGLRLSTQVVVPSGDYLTFLPKHARRKTIVIPIWPVDPVRPITTPHDLTLGAPLKVAFAGQLNALRGLDTGLAALRAQWAGPIELHVFSRNPISTELRTQLDLDDHLSVTEHGFIAPAELAAELQRCDFGWVCLDPDFAFPAFPSKSLTYLCAGLPIIYTGPSLPYYEQWLSDWALGLRAQSTGTADSTALAAFRTMFADSRANYLASRTESWKHFAGLL